MPYPQVNKEHHIYHEVCDVDSLFVYQQNYKINMVNLIIIQFHKKLFTKTLQLYFPKL
jgi:hypothetical protein